MSFKNLKPLRNALAGVALLTATNVRALTELPVDTDKTKTATLNDRQAGIRPVGGTDKALAEKSRRTELGTLRTKYLEALDTEMKAAMKRGDLDTALSLKKTIDAEGPPPSAEGRSSGTK